MAIDNENLEMIELLLEFKVVEDFLLELIDVQKLREKNCQHVEKHFCDSKWIDDSKLID